MNRADHGEARCGRRGPGRREQHPRHRAHDRRLQADDPQAAGRPGSGVRAIPWTRSDPRRSCRRVQVDEIWQFVYAKAKNVPAEKRRRVRLRRRVDVGRAVTPDSKLILSWLVGRARLLGTRDELMHRPGGAARESRSAHDGRLQGLSSKRSKRRSATDIDYAMLIKHLRCRRRTEKRYSPAKIVSSTTEVITGNPDPKHISTLLRRAAEPDDAHVDAPLHPADQWRSPRRSRTTRAAVALHFMHYNFAAIHQTLRVTPAMAAGLSLSTSGASRRSIGLLETRKQPPQQRDARIDETANVGGKKQDRKISHEPHANVMHQKRTKKRKKKVIRLALSPFAFKTDHYHVEGGERI